MAVAIFVLCYLQHSAPILKGYDFSQDYLQEKHYGCNFGGAGTAYPSGVSEFTFGFYHDSCCFILLM